MSRHNVEAHFLKAAYPTNDYEPLVERGQKFLQDWKVKKALENLSYNQSDDFRGVRYEARPHWPATVAFAAKTTRFATAIALHRAVSDTQKLIVTEGGFKGVLAMSQLAEPLERLLEGESFINELSVLDRAYFSKPIMDSRQRMRIHYAIALESIERRQKIPDPSMQTEDAHRESSAVSKITHGLQLGFSENGPSRLSSLSVNRGYSHGVSDDQLEQIWSYDMKDTSTYLNRIRGMNIRHAKLHEFGTQNYSATFPKQDPSLIVHTITSEVGGKGFIGRGARPMWFSQQPYFMGGNFPRHPEGRVLSLDDRHCNLQERIEDFTDQIAELLYDYPKK